MTYTLAAIATLTDTFAAIDKLVAAGKYTTELGRELTSYNGRRAVTDLDARVEEILAA